MILFHTIPNTQRLSIINNLVSREFFKVYSPTGFLDRDENAYQALYKAVCFHKVYSQKFSDDILLQAQYIPMGRC